MAEFRRRVAAWLLSPPQRVNIKGYFTDQGAALGDKLGKNRN